MVRRERKVLEEMSFTPADTVETPCFARDHSLVYALDSQEGDTFRGATKFTKGLKRTIDGAWDPPNVPVNVRLRGSGTLGVAREPLLHEVRLGMPDV